MVTTVQVTRFVAGVEVDYVGTDNELGARRAIAWQSYRKFTTSVTMYTTITLRFRAHTTDS